MTRLWRKPALRLKFELLGKQPKICQLELQKQWRVQQFNGREGETATLLKTFFGFP
jgi:hypothetical protein